MKPAIVSLSGGMDSATLIASLKAQEIPIKLAVSFNYGSKHNPYESLAAEKICEYYGLERRVINLSTAFAEFKSNLMRGQADVPSGHYTDATMSQTVVPGRNIIFSSILAGLAWSEECGYVYLGIHAGDHEIYPDCRPDFFKAMESAIWQGTDYRVRMVAPYLYTNKAGILKAGLELHVPYELTRTCYRDQVIACGKCGSCQERLESFKLNGIEDPIEYESRDLMPKDV